jgi:hypothetical protein
MPDPQTGGGYGNLNILETRCGLAPHSRPETEWDRLREATKQMKTLSLVFLLGLVVRMNMSPSLPMAMSAAVA